MKPGNTPFERGEQELSNGILPGFRLIFVVKSYERNCDGPKISLSRFFLKTEGYLQTTHTSKCISIHSPTHVWSYLDPMLLPTGHSWQGLRCPSAMAGSAFSFGWPRAHCTNRTPSISWGKAGAEERGYWVCYEALRRQNSCIRIGKCVSKSSYVTCTCTCVHVRMCGSGCVRPPCQY